MKTHTDLDGMRKVLIVKRFSCYSVERYSLSGGAGMWLDSLFSPFVQVNLAVANAPCSDANEGGTTALDSPSL